MDLYFYCRLITFLLSNFLKSIKTLTILKYVKNLEAFIYFLKVIIINFTSNRNFEKNQKKSYEKHLQFIYNFSD